MNPITIIDSIRTIPEGQWDALSEDNVFASYGWLLTVEESFLKQVIPIYFLFQESEKILGAAVSYLIPRNVKMYSVDDLLFGRLKKFIGPFGLSFLPAMVCCPLKAYGQHILLGENLSLLKKEKISERIINAVEQEAQKRKLSLSFPRVMKQEEMLIKQLCQRGYFQTLDLPYTYMDISWDSFEAYKKYIRKRSLNMKKNISREINKNRKSGVSIERVKGLDGQEERLYALLNGNSLKYNKMPLPFQANFLSRLKKNLGDDLVIYRSLKKGRISGLGVMLRRGDTGYLPFVGIDHDLAQNDATFFNMLFYRPITDAIEGNIKRLYFGNGKYDMKIRRGCKIQKAHFFHKPRHRISKPAVRLWFCFHRFWYQKKQPQPQNSDRN